jgi:hypothetical protein
MPDPNQASNLNLLLKFLLDKGQPKIDPSNFPQVPTEALTGALTKFDPTTAADITTSGYSVPGLKTAVMGGGLGDEATAQLYQLLTSQLRGMRGLETPTLLAAFQNQMR